MELLNPEIIHDEVFPSPTSCPGLSFFASGEKSRTGPAYKNFPPEILLTISANGGSAYKIIHNGIVLSGISDGSLAPKISHQ